MSFEDWIKRSDIAASEISRNRSIRVVLRAAYNAGERKMRKQMESVVKNAVQIEIEMCAKICDSIEYDYYRDNKCSSAIRAYKAKTV